MLPQESFVSGCNLCGFIIHGLPINWESNGISEQFVNAFPRLFTDLALYHLFRAGERKPVIIFNNTFFFDNNYYGAYGVVTYQ